MKNITLIVLVLWISFGYSQKKALVDSLKSELQLEAHDTIRVQKMIRLTHAYSLSNPDSAFYYAEKASVLSSKIGYQKDRPFYDQTYGRRHWPWVVAGL